MQLNRRPPRHPRSGPSCLLVLTVMAAFIAGAWIVANADDVRDAILPDPTPTPTRSAAAHALSCQLYERDGEFANAITACRSAVELAPGTVEFYLPLIDLLVQENQTEEALALAEAVVEIAPENDEVWRVKAAAHLADADRQIDLGQNPEEAYSRAVDAGDAATKLNPSNAEAYAYMAAAYIGLGSQFWDEAREAAELAYALEPTSPAVLYYYAQVLTTFALYESALELLQTANSLDRNYMDVYPSLASIYFFYSGERQRALVTLRDALELDPNNADLIDTLAFFNLVIGEYATAETYAERAVEADPEMVRARAHLGHAYYQQFNYPRAIEELEIAVAGYGEPTNVTSLYFAMLGLAYYRNASDAEAADACETALPLLEQAYAVSVEGSSGYLSAEEGLELCRQALRQ